MRLPVPARRQLIVRHVEVNPAGGSLVLEAERSVPIPSTSGGTPILTASMMVLPLANGILRTLTLPLEAEPKLE